MSGDKKPSTAKNFIIGGASGMFATSVVRFSFRFNPSTL